MTAVASIGLCGVAVFAVDVGHARVVRSQLQNVADATAHAAVIGLDGTAEGMDAAQAIGEEIATTNHVGGDEITVGGDGHINATITYGSWESGSFTQTAVADDVNAARVTVTSADTGAWFSRLAFGADTIQVSASAVALAEMETSGAGSVDCFIPLAIPDCLLEDLYTEEEIADVNLILNPPGVDNTGWARPGANPNGSWLRSVIGDCQSDGEVSIGDEIDMNNGVHNNALKAMAGAIDDSASTWDEDVWGELPAQASRSGVTAYGNTYEGPMFVFSDDSYCNSGGGSWNGTVEITGFVYGAVYDVVTSGPASGKNVKMRIDRGRGAAIGTSTGGPDYGVQASETHAVIVQ